MKVKLVLGPVVILKLLHIVVSSPVSSDSRSSFVQLSHNSKIDPIKFVRKTLEIQPLSTLKPETTTHSPGLRSLSHAEPVLNEVDNEISTNKLFRGGKSSHDKYLKSLGGKRNTDDVPHSRSKRSLLFLAIKKLIKLKIILLG